MATIRHIDSHPKRVAALVPASACVCLSALSGQRFDAGRAERFFLKRRKEGTEVWFVFGSRLKVNMSMHKRHYPANFAAARKWVADLSARHGLTLTEKSNASVKRRRIEAEPSA